MAPVCLPGQPQVQARVVDRYDQVGRCLLQLTPESSAQRQKEREARQHLGEAHHDEAVELHDGPHTDLLHSRAGQAVQFRVREAVAEGSGQAGAVEIAGGFACGE